MFKLAEKIANQICTISNLQPEIAMVLGSGWAKAAERAEEKTVIPYAALEGMPQCTVKGHGGNFILCKLSGKNTIIADGRFHLYEGKSMQEVLLPLCVMYSLGARKVIITNAAGGINKDFNVGDIMLICDHINFTGKNPLTGFKATENRPIFADMTEVYDKYLTEKIKTNLKNININCKEGVYLQVNGPSYETPAEIRAFSILGADAVGMSTVIESTFCRYLGIKVVALSCITNMAAGISKDKLSHSEVLQAANANEQKFSDIAAEIARSI